MPTNPVSSKTVSQMGFSPAQLAFTTDLVRNLTVQDLNDLAASFFGQTVTNPIVPTIRAVDLRSLEDLFTDYRAKALQSIAAGLASPGGAVIGPGGPHVGAPGGGPVACCCSSPCCSCSAAVELDPFREPWEMTFLAGT